MIIFGVVSASLQEALDLYVMREDAERVIANWDDDEPERAGELTLEVIELDSFSPN